MRILIPARKNSKGIPRKNRKLFDFTAKTIPKKYRCNTYIFSDDHVINAYGAKYGFNHVHRNQNSAKDTSTTKDMMVDFCSNFDKDDVIVMLYLTYPTRQWKNVAKAIKIFETKNLNSLLCKKEVKQTPYLMMYELEDGRGEQVIKHNFSRRQDYRKCFELCHSISIIKQSYLSNLNNNLYDRDTYFMEISDPLDIDSKKDMQCLLK